MCLYSSVNIAVDLDGKWVVRGEVPNTVDRSFAPRSYASCDVGTFIDLLALFLQRWNGDVLSLRKLKRVALAYAVTLSSARHHETLLSLQYWASFIRSSTLATKGTLTQTGKFLRAAQSSKKRVPSFTIGMLCSENVPYDFREDVCIADFAPTKTIVTELTGTFGTTAAEAHWTCDELLGNLWEQQKSSKRQKN